ncbi:MAG: hypothetical protein Q8L22_27180 [Reyranella sp.]|nr:hypothetical protein [Reyranella sp.]
MAVRWKRSMGIGLASLLAVLALSGCDAHFCPDPSPIEIATGYPTKPIREGRPPGPTELSLPLNAWVDLPWMTEFLRKTVTADGVDGLVSKYQFQCAPYAVEVGCGDCYICARTIAQRITRMSFLRTSCVDNGEVLVQASVGPGRTVRAMTYWRIAEDRAK